MDATIPDDEAFRPDDDAHAGFVRIAEYQYA